MAKLTTKQELFIQEYLKDLNATQAYLRAGYKANENVARTNGSRLLAKANIQAELQKAMAKRGKRTDITQDVVLKNLYRIAGMNFTPKEISNVQDGICRPFDVLKTWELIGKHLGMFKEKVELTGEGAEPVKVIFNIPKPNWEQRKSEEHSGK